MLVHLRRVCEDAAARVVKGIRPQEAHRIAVLFAVIMWSAYAVNMTTSGLIDRAGQLKGADFLQFYVLGHLAAEGDRDTLYDAAAYAAATRELVPDTVEVFPPVYPPHVSVFFAPLSELSYGWAATVWIVVGVLLYAGSCRAVWRHCEALSAYGATVGWLAAGSPAFFNLVGHGQTTSVVLALLVGMFAAMRGGRPVLAGLLLGLLVYKPQVGIAAGITMLVAREWRLVAGAVIAGALSVAAGWVYYGTPTMLEYVGVLAQPGELTGIVEQKLHHSHSLRTLWALLVPWRPLAMTLYVVTAAWVMVRTAREWQSGAPFDRRCSALVMATVLVSPHVFVYDLVILAPALLWLANWALTHPDHRSSALVRVLVVATWLAPILGYAALFTRVQLSVPILVALFYVTVTLDRLESEAGGQTSA